MSGALDLIDEFHRRQAAFYAGGDLHPVARMLTDDVRWHVPGTSPIAGDHVGRDAVLAYFTRRREIASATMRMTIRDSLVEDDLVVQRVDGHARLGGEDVSWRTVGIYRLRDDRVAECWLVPLDSELFDRLWSAGDPHAYPAS